MWNGVEANNLNRFLTRTGRQNGTTRRDKNGVGRTDGRGEDNDIVWEGVDSERNDELVCLCEKAQTGPELA